MNSLNQKCPECDGRNLFFTEVSSGGGYGPILLPGLGRLFRLAKFRVLVCEGCGLTRFYAEPNARAKLPTSRRWSRV